MAQRFDQIQLSDDGHNLYPYITGTDGYLAIQTTTGLTRIGSGNSSWTHIFTDRPNFYFSQGASFDGNIAAYGGSHTASFATYYDSNNTGYYMNPSGNSVLNEISIDDYIYHNGDTNTYLFFETDSIKLRTGGTDRLTLTNSSATFANNVRIPVAWDSGTLENNAIYAKNSNDGFGFGNGTGISTWWSWSTENGLMRMIDSANSGAYITLRTANTDRVSITSSGLSLQNSGDIDVGNVRIVGDNDSADQGTAWIRSNGDYIVINAVDGEHVYLNWDTGGGGSGNVYVEDTIFANNFFDRNDTNYYVDPSDQSRMKYLNLGTSPGSGITSGYIAQIRGAMHMTNNAINYVSQLHFQDDLRFYDDGNDNYLNFKYGDANNGAIKFLNGGGTIKGYVYASDGGFGLLDNDAHWAVRTQTGTDPLQLRCNDNVEFEVHTDHTLSLGSSRAPIFYDSDNTGYYLNPAASSKMVYLGLATDPNTSGGYRLNMGGSIDMNANNIDYVSQLHFNDNLRFYDGGDNHYLNFKWGNSAQGGIIFRDGDDAIQGYVYGSGNGDFGLLDKDGNWTLITNGASYTALRANDNEELIVYTNRVEIPGDIRAPIFYDKDDTGYYVNPAGTTNINTLVSVDANAATLSASVGVKSPNQNTNYAAHRWAVGNTNPQLAAFDGSYSMNGGTGENSIGYGTAPFNDRGLLWLAQSNDSTSNDDGGWNKDISNLSDDKAYISIVYVKRVGTSTNGTFYHGCHGSHTLNLDGTGNGNPYFIYTNIGNLPQDVWCVSIGIIQANNDSNTSNSPWQTKNGVYRLDTGDRIIDVSTFKMKDGSTSQRHRVYLYYSTDSNAELHFYNPGFYEINGQEPSLNDLLNGDGSELTAEKLTLNNGFVISEGGSNYANVNSWMYLQNNTGLYAPGNGAHIYPNTTSDYGAWRMDGARNNWNGITFSGSSSTFNTLMSRADGAEMGLYNDTDNEWYFEGVRNGLTSMYYNGTRRLETTNAGSKSTGRHEATTDMRAPIFYDSADTGYYVDPAGTSNLNGAAFASAITLASHLRTAAGGNASDPIVTPSNDTNTGIYFPGSGVTGVGGAGGLAVEIRVDAPVYYDSNNTSYYLDPANSTTSFKGYGTIELTSPHSHGNIWIHYDPSSDANKSALTAWTSEPGWTYANSGIGGNIHKNGPYYGRSHDNGYGAYIRFEKSSGNIEGWTTQATSGNNSGQGTKRWYSDASGNLYGVASVRAPIFYDSDDTNYYVNPASSSQMGTIDFNGVVSGTAAGASQIGRNHAYDTVELKGYGAEMMIGAQHNVIHINYRTCNNNASSHTPQTWYWRDGTSSGFSNHEFDRVTGHESVRSPIFYDLNDTNYYINPASTSLTNVTSANNFSVVAGNNNGIGFWGGTSGGSGAYAIYMSAHNGSNGGRVAGETTSDYNIYFKIQNGTNRGFAFKSGSTVHSHIDASGNIRTIADVIAFSSSDKNFKDELSVIENPLDKINNINGYNFTWNDKQTTYKSGTKDIGVVAQEIEKVLPEIVNTREDGSKAVKYDKIVPLLIEAIKELKTEIEEIKCKCDGCTR